MTRSRQTGRHQTRWRQPASNAALALAFVGSLAIPHSALRADPVPQPSVSQPTVQTTGVANINISPRRVVFDKNKRAEAVLVFNQGDTPVTVDVGLVDNVMLPTGEITPVDRAAEKGPEAVAATQALKSAKSLLLAAPSRLVLPPGQGRTIRVRALFPESDAAAEYRTHLTVTTVPPADTGLTPDQVQAVNRGELMLRIQSIFGVSIPLIVRSGTVDTKVSFGPIEAVTEKGAPQLLVPLRRSGINSAYGSILVRTAKKEIVGIVRGIGVYPEISERVAHVPLSRPLKPGETVQIAYVADDAAPDTSLCSAVFTGR